MPRSQNRRTIEVPVPRYDDLKARAAQEGPTIPAIVQALITDGKSVQEGYGEMRGLLYAMRQVFAPFVRRKGATLLPNTQRSLPGRRSRHNTPELRLDPTANVILRRAVSWHR